MSSARQRRSDRRRASCRSPCNESRTALRDRRLTTIDEPAAVAEAQSATRSMWTKFEAEGHDVPVPRFDALTGDPA